MDPDTDIVLRHEAQRGAAAVLIAAAMVVLLGVAAVALDVSAAWNERNQNQNAGDNGVMAGGIDKADQQSDQDMVTSVLSLAMANLTADFPGGQSNADWVAMWRNCVDDGNPGWVPLPEPTAWGGSGTLDCISQTTSLLRVRIPNQITDAQFGGVIGQRDLETNAVSISKAVLQQNAPPVVPFGIASGSTGGEFCLSSASSGTAYPPCTGPQTGAFGPIISPLFGDFGTHAAQCSGNTIRWFERNLVWGLDHQLSPWPHASTVTASPPTPWPGQAALDALPDINRDDCTLDPDGNAAPINGIPLNTVQVDTGFPDPGLTNALISNQTFDGRPSRLQLPTTATRPLMNQNTAWNVDNVGPWTFLTEASADTTCRASAYTSAMTTDQKVTQFEACLTSPTAGEMFGTSVTSSPRFVWAPEYVYDSPPGQKFTPIRGFRPLFIGGVWMNCPNPNSGNPCGAEFFPDEDESAPVCDGTFPSCKKIRVDQVSAWLIPDDALPQSVFDDFNDVFTDLEAELYQ